ncbi:hypothetical protein CHS0354_023811 [Potamilus streckersoni]|uniref:glycine--tRNA ligase n=1 Tax=Potamilus streckersoni TaxID=2493646 RepID=A0AAE0VMH2_9BIVA|nr:hypothetical protein CHS0354_023811 [Potamilus streckersoni]
MDKLVSLCKRRGFVFQSSEIYGGLSGSWDYGFLGVELKQNIKKIWWDAMTRWEEDIVGIDASILMNPRTWEASGHVESFTDPMIDDKVSKMRYRADHLIENYILTLKKKGKENEANKVGELFQAALRSGDMLRLLYDIIVSERIKSPDSGSYDWTEVRQFNLMFETKLGAVLSEASQLYLRPETAQGIFVNFHNVRESNRLKIPFGIAQIGKAFRNEIVKGNFIFRQIEFEQMEMQYFVKPGLQRSSFEEWREKRFKWYVEKLGIKGENLLWYEHEKLAHYADAAFDIKFKFPFGDEEIEGIHSRTDFDLRRHEEYSGKNMHYTDPQTAESFIPFVIETSAGCDRLVLATLCDAYNEDKVDGETRVVLRFNPHVAPIKVAILPLVKKDVLPEIAKSLKNDLKRNWVVQYDESGSIGRRYRRQDEIGTPICVTIDNQTVHDQTVTLRHRDTMNQKRISISGVEDLNSNKKVETSVFKFIAVVEDFEGYSAEFEGFKGDILVEATVKKREKRIDLTIITKTHLFATCDRCLRPCEQEASGEFNQMYLSSNEVSSIDDVFVRALPENITNVDLEDDIRETILLSKPIKILCHRFDCEIPTFDILENATQEISFDDPPWKENLKEILIVDAMGGDQAPDSPVSGALLALDRLSMHDEIVLVGDEVLINQELKNNSNRKRISIVHTTQVIDGDELPSEVLKTKRDSSMIVGLELCKNGKADAFVSAGSTGSQMAASLLILGRLPGVLRPTIGALFPNINGNQTLLIDVGANVDSKPQQMVQVAQMGTVYLKALWNVENPKVGLINIGEEETKGTELVKSYYVALRQAHSEGKINFVGNIEGRDIMFDSVNIALCDGFVGNVILKYAESIPKFIVTALKKSFQKKVSQGELSMKDTSKISEALKSVLDEFNEEKYGGVPLLGINGISIVCHGKSSPLAISHAVVLAKDMAEKKMNELIRL